jgi:hypothetical protein
MERSIAGSGLLGTPGGRPVPCLREMEPLRIGRRCVAPYPFMVLQPVFGRSHNCLPTERR